ncbi:helix-turn-helix domain-containing protein [uncultured Tateyamaria sp.]|uniref:helix-turn-helix domain-containing protein n=1 Tax=uncultured Tateyamaria sp. TaxID=455651 RepID=UPI00262FEFF1|nr:helix-turn-helix domain-containing protein [uncultured Tateyamaria sp.]
MSRGPYTRAIAAFEGLLTPPQDTHIDTPAALIRAAGLPSSTGYRHLTTLEGAGLLSRDKAGAYVIGPAALRIGLSAQGVGHLAVLAPPILLRLRETTGRTAFLALTGADHLNICTFSTGREARHAAPARTYRMSLDHHSMAGDVTTAYLTDTTSVPERLIHALLCPVPGTDAARIGVSSSAQTEDADQIRHHLRRCADLFRVAP